MKWIRWKAVWPLSVAVILGGIAWWFLLDPAVKWGVEGIGTRLVGARVDLREADVRLTDGVVALHGLQVTDPSAPMTNLFEVDDVVLNVRVAPLLERKVVIDTAAVRGVRFGTPRATSGALPQGEQEESALIRAVQDWVRQVEVPPMALSTLTQAVNVQAIAPESLATIRAAQAARSYVDTARAALAQSLQAADPRPTIDSAAALADRLQGADLRTLGLAGARQAVTDIRRNVTALTQLDDRLRMLEADVRGNAAGLGERLEAIPAARFADYDYARSLLQLPSLNAPALGPQLFSAPIAERVGRMLHWVHVAEKYIPPGLERRFQQGPDRRRASGTTVVFPRETTWPRFLLAIGELSLTLGGEGLAQGEYLGRITGLTTQPAVHGAPTTFLLERAGGRTGPSDARVAALLDRVGATPHDTLGARLVGVTLPTLSLPGLGATVALGSGVTELGLTRVGDSVSGRLAWRSSAVTWIRDTVVTTTRTTAVRFIEDAIWRAVARLSTVEIEARFAGSVTSPRLSISTNIASAIADALQAQLGEEIRRAEAQVRARVDALVEAHVAQARAEGDRMRGEVLERVSAERARLEQTKAALEARLRDLVRIPGIG
ncbi:MAG: TIGR03545 family protein [Gemmatimonadales bacterium]